MKSQRISDAAGAKESIDQPNSTRDRAPVKNERNSLLTSGDRNGGSGLPQTRLPTPRSENGGVTKRRNLQGFRSKGGRILKVGNGVKPHVRKAACEAVGLPPAVSSSGDPPKPPGDSPSEDDMSTSSSGTEDGHDESTTIGDEMEDTEAEDNQMEVDNANASISSSSYSSWSSQPTDSCASVRSGVQGIPVSAPAAPVNPIGTWEPTSFFRSPLHVNGQLHDQWGRPLPLTTGDVDIIFEDAFGEDQDQFHTDEGPEDGELEDGEPENEGIEDEEIEEGEADDEESDDEESEDDESDDSELEESDDTQTDISESA
ncbi:hypothetical protein ABW20_dc0104172 [Dactylellina cionopaga]|nr:hypothetical protein ABW20_dc0104172 [Dactylellina cionopaga]